MKIKGRDPDDYLSVMFIVWYLSMVYATFSNYKWIALIIVIGGIVIILGTAAWLYYKMRLRWEKEGHPYEIMFLKRNASKSKEVSGKGNGD